MDKYDIIVIGAGPAGVTAAVYAKRYSMNVAVVESGTVGGQLSTAAEVENYPGIRRMTGMEWAEKTRAQLMHLNIPVMIDTVESIKQHEGAFVLKLASGTELGALGVIIATGSRHRHLGVDGEERFAGKGISYCATCDGYFFKGKDVALVGGGNTAVTYALFMAGIASKVYLVHRRNEFRAESSLVEQLLKMPNVVPVLDCVVVNFDGKDMLERMRIRNVKTNEEKDIAVSAAFIAVGETPNNELAKGLGIAVDAKGNIPVNEKQETGVSGVYAAGDLTGKGWAQAVNAAAQGMAAGIECSLYVKNLKSKELAK